MSAHSATAFRRQSNDFTTEVDTRPLICMNRSYRTAGCICRPAGALRGFSRACPAPCPGGRTFANRGSPTPMSTDLARVLPIQRSGDRSGRALRLILFDLGDTLETGEQLRPGAMATLRGIHQLGDGLHLGPVVRRRAAGDRGRRDADPRRIRGPPRSVGYPIVLRADGPVGHPVQRGGGAQAGPGDLPPRDAQGRRGRHLRRRHVRHRERRSHPAGPATRYAGRAGPRSRPPAR